MLSWLAHCLNIMFLFHLPYIHMYVSFFLAPIRSVVWFCRLFCSTHRTWIVALLRFRFLHVKPDLSTLHFSFHSQKCVPTWLHFSSLWKCAFIPMSIDKNKKKNFGLPTFYSNYFRWNPNSKNEMREFIHLLLNSAFSHQNSNWKVYKENLFKWNLSIAFYWIEVHPIII